MTAGREEAVRIRSRWRAVADANCIGGERGNLYLRFRLCVWGKALKAHFVDYNALAKISLSGIFSPAVAL